MGAWKRVLLSASAGFFAVALAQAQMAVPPAPAGVPTGAPAVAPAASAASAPLRGGDGRPTPRLLSPAEQRDSGKPLGEAIPEGRAVPQLSIPIGPQAASAAAPARAGTVSDTAARCQAEENDALRARCRANLARTRAAPAPPPRADSAVNPR